jgi:membrane-associated phospholipid phosphatase
MGADTAQIEAPGTGRDQAARLSRRAAGTQSSTAPLLEPAPGGPAARFAQAVGETHPVRAFLVAAIGGYALLVGLMVALGFLLTKVLLRSHGLSARDEHFSVWLARHRTPTLVDLSWLGSTLAGGLVIPVVVGGLLLAFVLAHRWRLAAFTLFVICIESGAYRATSLVVHRDRPRVHRLESLPVDASYPSGHTAASVALYGGLLLVLASRLESAALRVLLYALAVAIPAFVTWARLLRGMHHVTDTAAGALMGLLALAVTVFAARAAGAAAAARDTRRAGS